MSEGTTRAEAAAHILARETGRRMRAVQARIDEVEEERKIALFAIASRLVDHEQADERQSGLIDGLRSDIGTAREITAALDVAHGETRELTAAQAQELVSIAERLAANEQIDSAQDAELTGLTGRIEGLELRAPVPGPPGPKGPAGPSGRVAYGGGGGSATIQSAGTLVANRPILNFVSGATVADDATNNRVNITVSGGGGTINSVSVSSGLSITGTSDLTITNTGVRSLAGSGISVSDSTGAVTITAASVTGGTGITVAGSGTTALTVSATGVQSLTAGNGISVSGTTTPTVSASLAAGTGIGISGTTTLSVSNTGVTSLVAGTNVSVSGATGAVTVNAPAYGTTITASTIGGTAAAGTSTTIAREDHKHAFPSGAAPSALTVSSTQATGTSTAPALADHVHAMPGSATAGASAVGDTAATGTATTVALSDHRHSREAFGTPGAVTGGATAASGSATTLARSDHVHSTASMPVLLASTTLGSDTASVTFSSISGAYYTLNCIYQARCITPYGNAGEYLMVRLNGDTAGNYYSPISNTTTTTATMAEFGVINTTSNWDAQATGGNAWVYGYSNTTWFKTIATTAAPFNNSTTAFSPANYISYYNSWRSTAVVTSLTILPLNGGNLKSGSTFRLYGYP